MLIAFGFLAAALLLAIMSFHSVLFGEPLSSVPDSKSLRAAFPRADGWSEQRLEEARRFAEASGVSAIVVLHNGRLVAEWGATDRRIDAHSVRKSLVSALFGVVVDRGLIATNKSLESLDIDDDPPLSGPERQATIADLLTSRSAVYRNSVKNDVERDRPQPGDHPPGAHFFYNNWGFNALGGIFERVTESGLGPAFQSWFAEPLGMQDFRTEDVRILRSHESEFAAYRFRISARDLSRFGLLFFQNGEWEGRRVLSEQWIRESTRAHVAFPDGYGYGYLWWTYEDGSYWAAGTGSQMLLVDPSTGLVVVSRVDTRDGIGRWVWNVVGKRSSESSFFQLVHKILAAAPG